MFNLIILGPQGSGKGTQAQLLADRFGFVVIGAGDALREIAKEDTELGREVHQIINVEGRLVRPEIIARVVEARLQKISKDQGVILESFPRALEQYQIFSEFWPKLDRGDYKVIFIELSEEEAVKRLSTRLTCEQCGRVYILGQVGESCPKCGDKLSQREDDRPEAVRTRLQLYNSETLPMVEVMEVEGKVIRVDGAPPIEEVHQVIISKLGL